MTKSAVWLKDETTGKRRTFYGVNSDDACAKARKFALKALQEARNEGKQTQERFYLITGGETYGIEG